MRSRRLRLMHRQAGLRRRVAFFALSHDHEPDEFFVDPASAHHDDLVATLPPLPPRRAARYRDQLEFWQISPASAPAVAG